MAFDIQVLAWMLEANSTGIKADDLWTCRCIQWRCCYYYPKMELEEFNTIVYAFYDEEIPTN